MCFGDPNTSGQLRRTVIHTCVSYAIAYRILRKVWFLLFNYAALKRSVNMVCEWVSECVDPVSCSCASTLLQHMCQLSLVLYRPSHQHSNPHGSFVPPGPRLFLSCPMDVEGSRVWFTDLWNYSLVPYLLEAVREGLQVRPGKTHGMNWRIFPWLFNHLISLQSKWNFLFSSFYLKEIFCTCFGKSSQLKQ